MTEKKIFEGWVCFSRFFGISLHKEMKDNVSLSDDLFTRKMKDLHEKKVKITVELLEE